MSDRLAMELEREARELAIVERAAASRRVEAPMLASTLVRFNPAALQTPPAPREYVWAPRVPAGRVTVLVGAGGTSKTGMAAALAVAVALGEPLFGADTMKGRVVYLTAEDRAEDLHRHLYELTRGRTPAELQTIADNIAVHDVVGIDLKLVRKLDGAPAVTAQAQELAEICRSHGAVLCVIDTASRVNGAGEDNDGLARLIEACELLSREAGCAVLLNHHVGKQQLRDNVTDQYAGRGGTALSDNARSVLQLSVAKDARRIPVADAALLVAEGRLLVLGHVKANYSAREPDVYLRRDRGPFAATLHRLPILTDADPVKSTWTEIARWLAEQRDVPFPTQRTIDGLDQIGTRAERRRAVEWALDRDLVREAEHPSPRGKGRTFLTLGTDANGHREAANET